MDPLDQHLTDAGAAWRQSQPEPPDLHRMVASLEPGRSRGFSRSLAFIGVVGLLVLGAVVVLPGVGGFFQAPRNGLPIAPTASVAPSASELAAKPSPTSETDAAQATALLGSYVKALIAGQWQTAFDMLAPTSPTAQTGITDYSSERAAYFASVAGQFTMGAPTQPSDWTTYAPLIDGADLSRASLIEVDYPALSGNNAGYELFVVAPDASGDWKIWPVR